MRYNLKKIYVYIGSVGKIFDYPEDAIAFIKSSKDNDISITVTYEEACIIHSASTEPLDVIDVCIDSSDAIDYLRSLV